MTFYDISKFDRNTTITRAEGAVREGEPKRECLRHSATARQVATTVAIRGGTDIGRFAKWLKVTHFVSRVGKFAALR
jgi:hypothetical protein